MTAPELSDNELVALMRRGDENALATLYRRRQGNVYRFALQMSGSPALAEDVVQEVFIILMRDRGGYDAGRGALSSFLLGIARNLVRQRQGREQIYAPLEDELDDAPSPEHATHTSPLDEMSRVETIESVRRAVLSLPSRYREVVVLCELQELSYTEAAEILGCAIGTVRSRLHRARALLIEKMRPATDAPERSEVKTARCFA